MSWMFRWLDHLLTRLRPSSGNEGWVEPGNAITRAILSGAVAQLPAISGAIDPEVTPAEITPLPERVQPAPATRTAQRTRRRRAGRAA